MRPTHVSRLPPFARVVEAHGPALLRYCAAEAGWERAEDCFQEAMLLALAGYPGLRDPGAIRSWLFTIAARTVVDEHRRAARAPRPVADVAELAGAAEDGRRDDALWARVGALPDKQRRAVALRYLADLPYREVARVMGIGEAAARRNAHEGVARLRQEMTG